MYLILYLLGVTFSNPSFESKSSNILRFLENSDSFLALTMQNNVTSINFSP